MSAHCILTFATEGGRTKQVRISEPKQGLDADTVIDASEGIIAGDIFITDSGSLASLKKAELRRVTRNKIL